MPPPPPHYVERSIAKNPSGENLRHNLTLALSLSTT
jgi:hypothetical protein